MAKTEERKLERADLGVRRKNECGMRYEGFTGGATNVRLKGKTTAAIGGLRASVKASQ